MPHAGDAGDDALRPKAHAFGGKTAEFMAALIVYAEKMQPGVVSLSYIACQKSPKPNLGNFDMDKVAGKKASKPKDATLKDGADWLLLKGIASRVFSEKSGEVTLESGAKVGKGRARPSTSCSSRTLSRRPPP